MASANSARACLLRVGVCIRLVQGRAANPHHAKAASIAGQRVEPGRAAALLSPMGDPADCIGRNVLQWAGKGVGRARRRAGPLPEVSYHMVTISESRVHPLLCSKTNCCTVVWLTDVTTAVAERVLRSALFVASNARALRRASAKASVGTRVGPDSPMAADRWKLHEPSRANLLRVRVGVVWLAKKLLGPAEDLLAHALVVLVQTSHLVAKRIQIHEDHHPKASVWRDVCVLDLDPDQGHFSDLLGNLLHVVLFVQPVAGTSPTRRVIGAKPCLHRGSDPAREIGTRLRLRASAGRRRVGRADDAVDAADAVSPLLGERATAAPAQPNRARPELACDGIGGRNRGRWRRRCRWKRPGRAAGGRHTGCQEERRPSEATGRHVLGLGVGNPRAASKGHRSRVGACPIVRGGQTTRVRGHLVMGTLGGFCSALGTSPPPCHPRASRGLAKPSTLRCRRSRQAPHAFA
jgi:hypothetical protein